MLLEYCLMRHHIMNPARVVCQLQGIQQLAGGCSAVVMQPATHAADLSAHAIVQQE